MIMSPLAFCNSLTGGWLRFRVTVRRPVAVPISPTTSACGRSLQIRRTLDLSAWTVAFNGAEPVLGDTLDRFTEAFEPCGFRREAFFPCYGLAEATLIVSGGDVKRPPVVRHFQTGALKCGRVAAETSAARDVRRLVGCGHATPDQAIVIVDPQNETRCPPDRVGEIWVRGPSVAQGYWHKPDSTQDTFFASLQPTGEGPFLRTGDLGFLHDNELFVTGRIKNMIIVRGLNHYPQDLEHTIEGAVAWLAAGLRGSVRSRGRGPAAIGRGSRGRERRGRRICENLHGHPPRRYGYARSPCGPDRAGQGQQHRQDIERQDSALCVPGGISFRGLPIVSQWQIEDAEVLAEPPAAEVAEPAAASPQSLSPHAKEESGGSDANAEADPGERRASAPRRDRSGLAPVRGAAEAVLEEVRRVGKQRAAGVTIDSAVADAGLDSLERMEILASLEDRFGGRFPEDVLPELQTWRQVVQAVEAYLGRRTLIPGNGKPVAEAAIPTSFYRVAEFPEAVALRQTLENTKAAGLENPYFQVHDGTLDNRATIAQRNLINFSTFNYLGMAADPVVVQAVKDACDRYGASACASRLVSGETALHQELEQAIARFLGVDDALTFVAGHSTNESVIGHLMGPDDLILHDALRTTAFCKGRSSRLAAALLRIMTGRPREDCYADSRRLSPRVDGDRGRLQHGWRHPGPAPLPRD